MIAALDQTHCYRKSGDCLLATVSPIISTVEAFSAMPSACWLDPRHRHRGKYITKFQTVSKPRKNFSTLEKFESLKPSKTTYFDSFMQFFSVIQYASFGVSLVKIVHYEMSLFCQSILCRKLPSIDDCKYFNICKGCQIMMLW